MDAKDIAAVLTGSEYPLRVPAEVAAAARAARLVIVYGASDDLMEFRGAVDDEVGAWKGTEVRLDAGGLVPRFEDIDRDARDAEDRLRDCFRREGGGVAVKAVWGDGGCPWPHETFEVVEDGGTYCRGIVLALPPAP